MADTSRSDFSFDLYPGLDADLAAAYERNVALGTASPAAVGNALNQSGPNTLSPVDIREWAQQDLETQGSLQRWANYGATIGMERPLTVDQLGQKHPELAATLTHLFEVKQTLTASGEVNPEGINLGETMHLVAVPWQAFRSNLPNLRSWVNTLRAKQGIGQGDFMDENIIKAIQEDTPFYRKPRRSSELISAIDYLDYKISRDGPWGLLLVQTSNQAGIKRLVEGPGSERTPDALTRSGMGNFKIHDETIDNMGLFEWLALTFQEDPRKLSSTDVSWLLANRLDVGGAFYVPRGCWGGDQVGSYLVGADNSGGLARPRLAVMKNLS